VKILFAPLENRIKSAKRRPFRVRNALARLGIGQETVTVSRLRESASAGGALIMRKAAGLLATSGLAFVLQMASAGAQLPSAAFPATTTAASPAVPKSQGETPDVIPGDDIEIACQAVEKRAADSDVRVVLTISAVPGESTPGYVKVLATDEQLLKDAVRVRIPELPSLEDHTVGLDVYVVGSASAEHCDAGHMKIS
jgi:hypothetical protein